MKNLFFSLLAVVAMSFTVSAQRTATTISESEFITEAANFTYVFFMPGNVSHDEAMFQADALTQFMEVDFNEDSQTLKIRLLNGTMDEKRQVKRLLFGLRMENIEMDGSPYEIMDFVQDYVEIH